MSLRKTFPLTSSLTVAIPALHRFSLRVAFWNPRLPSFTICQHVLRHRDVPPHHSEIRPIPDRVINLRPRLPRPSASLDLVASESRGPVARALAYSRRQARSH